jgi:hypothetical protein
METGEWKGVVTASLQFNDKEHERLFEAVQKHGEKNLEEHKQIREDIAAICGDVTRLKLMAEHSGKRWGIITGAATSILVLALGWLMDLIKLK